LLLHRLLVLVQSRRVGTDPGGLFEA
jgi:hypothetical protein